MLLSWNERSVEDQSLFNPAFCSLLLRESCRGYGQGEKVAIELPLPLSFLVLPLVLNQNLRRTLPTLKTKIATWTTRNPAHLAEFGERARGLSDVTKEAIQFGCGQNWLSITAKGIAAGEATLKPDPAKSSDATEDIRDCYKAANFIGRWFPKNETPTTIMSLLGVAP
jgi:hypothetical protein